MRAINYDKEQFSDCISSFETNLELYSQNINSFFKTIRNIPNLTHEWAGDVADSYIELILSKEQKYLEFCEVLSSFATIMNDIYDNFDAVLTDTKFSGEEV